jgi:hypothetical protein
VKVSFRADLESGNAAMQTPEDVADALEDVARRIRRGCEDGAIKDLNGNTVGRWGLDIENENDEVME